MREAMRIVRIVGIVSLGIILVLKLLIFLNPAVLMTPTSVACIVGLVLLIIWKPKTKPRDDESGHYVENAKEPLEAPLLDVVARQLTPRYCEKCGSRLEVRRLDQRGFDRDTGYPKCVALVACPHATIYETDILRGVKFTWKSQPGGHYFENVPIVVYPEDRNKNT